MFFFPFPILNKLAAPQIKPLNLHYILFVTEMRSAEITSDN